MDHISKVLKNSNFAWMGVILGFLQEEKGSKAKKKFKKLRKEGRIGSKILNLASRSLLLTLN